MFVPHVVIKLLSVLGRRFCCCKSIVCYYLRCVSGVYVCSLSYDKAGVRSGKVVLLSLFVQCLLLPPLLVCSLCYDKAGFRSGKVVLLSLFVQCLLLPPLLECGLWVPLLLL